MLKRLIDILLCLAATPVVLPVAVVLSLAIKAGSTGPVLFRQQRAGRHARTFMLLKFRTMQQTAEPFGPSPQSGDDPRLTHIGRFLREHSLDELPQLWNVLKGDMTLVGPRPLYVSQIAEWNDRQKRRLEAKPGLTGLAQITGRGGLTREQKLELDVRYVESSSLRLDLKILAATIGLVFRRDGIYEKQYSQTEKTRGDASGRSSPVSP